MDKRDTGPALLMLSALAQVAWADGKLLPQEAAFFAEIVVGLGLDEVTEARAWRSILMPPEEPVAFTSAGLREVDQQRVLKVGYAMAKADGAVSEEELRAICELGEAFGLSRAQTLERIGHPIAW